MAVELHDLRPRELADGVELAPAPMTALGPINDLAYGIEGPGWAAAMDAEPGVEADAAVALTGGDAVACAAVLDRGDDTCVTAVATLPEHRGRGLAGALISHLLAAAGERGISTASLQASRAGAPVYERLGFADVGFIEQAAAEFPDNQVVVCFHALILSDHDRAAEGLALLGSMAVACLDGPELEPFRSVLLSRYRGLSQRARRERQAGSRR